MGAESNGWGRVQQARPRPLEVMSSITTDPGTIIELSVDRFLVDRFNVQTFMMCKYEYLAFVKRCVV